jgi:hypothetical protein
MSLGVMGLVRAWAFLMHLGVAWWGVLVVLSGGFFLSFPFLFDRAKAACMVIWGWEYEGCGDGSVVDGRWG